MIGKGFAGPSGPQGFVGPSGPKGFVSRPRLKGSIGARAKLVGCSLAWMLTVPARADATPPTAPVDPVGSDPATASAESTPTNDTRPLTEALTLEPGLSCLERESLLEHLATWRSEEQLDRRISLRVRGSETDRRAVHFELLLDGEPWIERSFDPAPKRCADRHAVVALAIAIALDDTLAAELGLQVDPEQKTPDEHRDGSDEEPGGGHRDGGVVQATDDELPPWGDDGAGTARPTRTPLSLTFAGGVFAGVTPRLSAGGLLSFDVRPLRHFDVRFGVLGSHLGHLPLEEGAVAVTLAAGRVDLCWGTLPRSIRLRACGGFAGGALHAQGRGYGQNEQDTLPWLAVLAGVDLAVHLVGPLSLELRLEGVVALQRIELDVRSSEGDGLASARFPPAGFLAAVGPRFEF